MTYKPKPVPISNDNRKKLADKVWRMNNLYVIKNRSAQLMRFKENEAQTHYRLNRHTRNIILKSRRLGFTTREIVDMLDNVLWHPIDTLIIAHTEPDALKIFDDMVSLAWEHYPFKWWYELDTERANKLKFGWGKHPITKAQRYSAISVANSGRSGNYNHVLISEFGKICAKYPERARELVSGTIPTVPLDGQLTIESTAEGAYGYFHDMFWEAWNRPKGKILKPTDLKAHFYNWTWDKMEMAKILPEHIIPSKELPQYFQDYQKLHSLTDLEINYYYQQWIALAKDMTLLKQEYPTTPLEAFEASGNTLFDRQKIEYQMMKFATVEPKVRGAWLIYEEANPKHVYAIGADPSEGIGGDHAAAVVIDFTPTIPRIVATFKNEYTTPDMLAYEIANMGKTYNTALLAPERNNHGHATIQKLKEIYPHEYIFHEQRTDKSTNESTDKLGWATNVSTKSTMVFDFNAAVNDDAIQIPDKSLLTEMRTYTRDDVGSIRLSKEQTNHWDLLIAAMITYQMRNYVERSTQVVTYIAPKSGNVYNMTSEQLKSEQSKSFDPFSPI